MSNPAPDHFGPTLHAPNSMIDRFLGGTEEQTGANIFVFPVSEYAKSDKKYALWRFTVNDTPLSTTVTFRGGRWFAELDWLNLFGEGDSPSDAISNLSDHIEHFIEFYSETGLDNLTEHAKETRDRFMSIILNP